MKKVFILFIMLFPLMSYAQEIKINLMWWHKIPSEFDSVRLFKVEQSGNIIDTLATLPADTFYVINTTLQAKYFEHHYYMAKGYIKISDTWLPPSKVFDTYTVFEPVIYFKR